jgi:hypothetical protein
MNNTNLDIDKNDLIITACIKCGQGAFVIDKNWLYHDGPAVFICPFCDTKTEVRWYNTLEIEEKK